jgi:hypothetical protein
LLPFHHVSINCVPTEGSFGQQPLLLETPVIDLTPAEEQ